MTEIYDTPGAWNLVVAFPDDSQSFAHGFQAGILWQQMRCGLFAEIDQVTRSENREVIDRMAVADGWKVERESTDVDGWDQTSLTKIGPPLSKPNPHGLKIVGAALRDGGK